MSTKSFSTLKPQNEDSLIQLTGRLVANQITRDYVETLASAARTATTVGSVFDVEGAKGIAIWLSITAASGTGGLHPFIHGIHPSTNGSVSYVFQPIALTSTQTALLICYPGSGIFAYTGGRASLAEYQARLPSRIRLGVTHDDASSYTYSMGYTLLP